MTKRVTVDSLMFEVADSTVTLRNEEWMTALCAMEILAGGTCDQPDTDTLRRVIKRVFQQMLNPESDGEAPVD